MSHIYIDGTKITANANKGNDQLLPEYNIQQCKQKNTETHFFVNLGFFDMLFFTAFCLRLLTFSKYQDYFCLWFVF